MNSINDENVSQETKTVPILNPLDKKATQVDFAELVGITQPAVSKHIGRCLQKGQTLKVWLHAYCEHLRNEAAGRGGNDQDNLTRARTNESEVKTALNRLEYNQKIGVLLPAADAEHAIIEWASYAVREFTGAFSSLVHEIEGAHGIRIDAKRVDEITSSSLVRVSAYAETIGKKLMERSNTEN